MEAGAQGTDLVVRHFGDLLVKCLDLKIGRHNFNPRVMELPMAFLRALADSCARGRNTELYAPGHAEACPRTATMTYCKTRERPQLIRLAFADLDNSGFLRLGR